MKPRNYKRYTSKYQDKRENSIERKEFERKVIEGFLGLYQDENHLNTKLERSLFQPILNEIGYSLQEYARTVANDKEIFKEINEALEKNPVPEVAKEIMTDEFRIFCLSLNALKQWLSAEQASMDRVLLGGEFKSKLKKLVTHCPVNNEELRYSKKGQVNYHHPMRDGRFPLPMSKHGHDTIEGQLGKL
jgi:hypothetical protein